jgi:hypothetical protein
MTNSSFHRYLLIAVFFIPTILQLRSQPVESLPVKDSVTTLIFDSSFSKALYKGQMDISKYHLTGLFFIKKMAPGDFRVVFSNEMGMTFFDLEIRNDSLIQHSVFPSMQRKSLLKILKSDLTLLLDPDTNLTRVKPLESKDKNLNVYKLRTKKGSYRYSYYRENGMVRRVETCGSLLGKTDILLDGGKAGKPAEISILNPTIGLQIKMKVIGK